MKKLVKEYLSFSKKERIGIIALLLTIGFFFLITMLFKMLNGIMFLLSGGPFIRANAGFQTNTKRDDDFDDFEEIN